MGHQHTQQELQIRNRSCPRCLDPGGCAHRCVSNPKLSARPDAPTPLATRPMRHLAKRDALDKLLLLALTANVVWAGVAVFKDRARTGPSDNQLLAQLESAQKEHHSKEGA